MFLTFRELETNILFYLLWEDKIRLKAFACVYLFLCFEEMFTFTQIPCRNKLI